MYSQCVLTIELRALPVPRFLPCDGVDSGVGNCGLLATGETRTAVSPARMISFEDITGS